MLFTSLWLCGFGPQLLKDTLCYELSIYNFSTQLRATTCLSLHLAGFSSSHTNGIATSTCARVCFQIPHHTSIALPSLFSTPCSYQKRRLLLFPGFWLSHHFFPIFNFPYIFVPARLSILIISSKRAIQDTYDTKLPKTALKSFTFWCISPIG